MKTIKLSPGQRAALGVFGDKFNALNARIQATEQALSVFLREIVAANGEDPNLVWNLDEEGRVLTRIEEEAHADK